jgi:hypothetical protein
MAPGIERAPFGLRVLMWLCLLTGIFAFLDLISTIYPLYPSRYVFPETPVYRAISIVVGLSFVPLFYGIRRRLASAWKLGWVILIATFSWFLVQTLTSLRQKPQSGGGWVAATSVTIMSSVIAIYWGRWWKRQKEYFSQPGL